MARNAVRSPQFLVVVGGAVCASFELSSDDCQLVASMLRSGEGSGPLPGDTTGAYLSDLEHSAWPDGGLFYRPTVIQVWKNNGGSINSLD